MLEKQEEYHEDFGDCLFFHFESYREPPDVCCGSPLDCDWDEKYWTHFVRFDFNQAMEQAEREFLGKIESRCIHPSGYIESIRVCGLCGEQR